MFITSNGQNITSFSACGTKPFHTAGEMIFLAEPKIDFICPEVPFPTNALYKQWGEANIRAMVHHHHNLLRKSSIGNLFPADNDAFIFATEKTADFFIEALGGDKAYSPIHGHPALRRRHLPFTVDEKGREIWLMMYKKTINDLQMPEELIEEFWNWIEPLSMRMINRRTTMMPIDRYPYAAFWGKE
ncbi:MAG: globin [Sulfurovaceae bacterium]|nr:globin [Sulfurovaceae bacterium]